ncbi:hypothetical protein ACQ0MK_10095 [Thalassospira lucentensis]|uniref:hypothetical protein n=1 Tax=Thalassospira lucentensis TaxID=168935 RepID=UPI003D2EB834
MPSTSRYIGSVLTVSSALIAMDVQATELDETQQDSPAFALFDLRATTAWDAFSYRSLTPTIDMLDTLITSAGGDPMRLDFVMDNIVPPLCELRPDPENCDGPGIPVGWMENIPQTICMDIPADISARHANLLGNSNQLCLEPATGLMLPNDWVNGGPWAQLHLHQTVSLGEIRRRDNTATIDLTVTDAITTRLATLSEQGYGPAKIGLDKVGLRKIIGDQLDQFISGDDESCTFLQSNSDPSGLGYLILDDVLARISIYADEYDVATSLVKTANGISLGASREDVYAAFDGQPLIEEDHEYLGANGRYVTWWRDAQKTRGIRFEINEEGFVTAIHAGSDAITLLEGCS